MKPVMLCTPALAIAALTAGAAQARDNIQIAGSSTVLPYATIVAEAFGEKLALGLYHDYSGYVVFSVAIGLMIGLGSLLNLNFMELRERWKYALLSPTS